MHKKILKIVLSFLTLIIVGITICLVLILSKVNDRPTLATEKFDCILVLGSKINPNGAPAQITKERLDAALSIAKVNPQAKLIVSGGKGADEPVSEAQAMANYLEHQGLTADRIIKEPRATNTSENLKFSRRYLSGKTVLVTSDFHLYRALYLASRADLQLTGYAVRTPISSPLLATGYYSHEILGLMYAFVFGTG